MRCPLTIFLLLFTYLAPMLAQVPPGFVAQEIARNLNPTALAFSPDGRLFVVEKDGEIREVVADVLAAEPFLVLPNVDITNERGLSGLCFHPNFPATPYCYVYYTVKNRSHNRLSRFSVTGSVANPQSETVLMELDPLIGSIHNSGALRFGLDKKLYVAVGDGANPGAAQGFDQLLGKILRLNDDGSIPTDNPFYGQLAGRLRAIYALGFRNPFSMDVDPVSGTLLVGDVGQSNFEEINRVEAGKNYGWPLIEGRRSGQPPPNNYRDPLFAYSHSAGCAVTGVAFYNPPTPRFPAAYKGKFFFADYCRGTIQTLDPETGVLTGTLVTGIDRPVALAVSPTGYLYYAARAGMGGGSQQDNTATWNGTLHKLSYFDSGQPYITRQSGEAILPVGEVLTLTVEAVGQKPLTYQWFRNNVLLPVATGPAYTLASPTLADNGAESRCVVGNALGTAPSRPMLVRVVAGQRPVPQLTEPRPAARYRAGDSITFAGAALGANGQPLPGATLTWWIDFHHDEHLHPAMNVQTGKGGSYPVPRQGETATNVWYRVHLRATSATGLWAETFTDVLPRLASLTVGSDPPEASLTMNGAPVQTPLTVEVVVGTVHTLEARPYLTAPTGMYQFVGWGNGDTAPRLSYTIPDAGSTLTPTYQALPPPGGNGFWGEYFTNTAAFGPLPTVVRIDPQIDFNWVGKSPAWNITNDNFLARWTGSIRAPITDTYTFFTRSDDGVRLWVNNKLLIDKWVPQPDLEWQGKVDLEANKSYDVRLEYQELQGEAVMLLRWAGTQFNKGHVPASVVFSQQVITALDPVPVSVRILPTPATGRAMLTHEAITAGTAHLEILDLLGRVMHQETVPVRPGPNNYPLALGTLPAGLYVVRFSQPGQPAAHVRLLVR